MADSDLKLERRRLDNPDDRYLAFDAADCLGHLPLPVDSGVPLSSEWAATTETQRLVHAAVTISNEIYGDGLYGVFFNGHARLIPDAIKLFELIDLQPVAQALRSLVALFPDSRLPPTQSEVEEHLKQRARERCPDPDEYYQEYKYEKISDMLFAESERVLFDHTGENGIVDLAIARFIRSHPKDFFQ